MIVFSFIFLVNNILLSLGFYYFMKKKYESEIGSLNSEIERLKREAFEVDGNEAIKKHHEDELQIPIAEFRKILKLYLDPLLLRSNNPNFYDAYKNLADYNMETNDVGKFLFNIHILENWYFSIRKLFDTGKCDLKSMKDTLDLFIKHIELIDNEFNKHRQQNKPISNDAYMKRLEPKYNEFIIKINSFYADNFTQTSGYGNIYYSKNMSGTNYL